MEEEHNQEDRLHNLQQEFDRKVANAEQKTASQLDQINAQLQALADAVKPAPKVEEPDWQSLSYEPDRMAEEIRKSVEGSLSKRLEAQQQAQVEQNKVMSELFQKFPDLANPGTPLYQAASGKIASLSDQSPAAIKAAVYEAAFETKPEKPKTGSDNKDDFSFGSGKGSREVEKGAGKGKSKVNELTLAWSQLMGRNIEDPSIREGLEKAASRKNWRKYS